MYEKEMEFTNVCAARAVEMRRQKDRERASMEERQRSHQHKKVARWAERRQCTSSVV